MGNSADSETNARLIHFDSSLNPFNKLQFVPPRSIQLIAGYFRQNERNLFGEDGKRSSYFNTPVIAHHICVLYYHPLTIRAFNSEDTKCKGNFNQTLVAKKRQSRVWSGVKVKLSDDVPTELFFSSKQSIEFIQDINGPWRWYGFNLSNNEQISEGSRVIMSIWIKFVNKIPKRSNNFGLKQYGRVFNEWVNGCKVGEWKKVQIDVKCGKLGDGGWNLFILDSMDCGVMVRFLDLSILIIEDK